ncbi:MAG: apolipoprotein N-acyltransferase [Acidithiobacillus sp.]
MAAGASVAVPGEARPGLVWRLLLAMFLGALWPLAFAPFDYSFLAFLLLAGLFLVSAGARSAKSAAAMGYLFGFAAFAAGTYWIAITLHNFAHMSWILAGALVGLLAAYCAIYPALALGLAHRFFPGPARWLAVPVLWILSEWARSRFATGFPWLATGYTQTEGFLGGLAPWLGQYGVGLATAVVAATAAWAWTQRRDVRALWAAISTVLLVFALALFAGTVRFTHPQGSPLHFRLLQGDIPISEKWNPERIDAILTRYARLIAASPPGTQLIALPETAFPIFQTEIPGLIAHLQDWSAEHDATLIIGIPESSHGKYYNAAMEIHGHDPLRWYRKQHLVPFGEYIPFPAILGPIVHDFLPGLGSFTPGVGSSVLPVDGQKAGMSICYEESFSRDVRKGVVEGASFLLNISDYAWYGHSIASAQSLQMAAMQARQEQKPDLRATNTGVTAVIAPNGRVLASLPQFIEAGLDGVIQPMAGRTPYGRLGSWPLLLLSLALLALAWWRLRRTP